MALFEQAEPSLRRTVNALEQMFDPKGILAPG
jgi:hypothetical protein